MQSLFNGYPLSTFLNNRYTELQEYIDSLTPVVLERGLSVLLEEIESKFFLHVPLLEENKIHADYNEVSIIQNDFGRSVSVKATKFTFFMPFSGNLELLHHKPSCTNSLKPQIERIEQGQIIISITKASTQSENIKEELKGEKNNIKTFLSYVEDEVKGFYMNKPEIESNGMQVIGFNYVVTATAKYELKKRQTKLQKDEDVFKKLGYPLKRKESTFPDYTAVPLQRKIKSISLQQQQSEPSLSDDDYEDILFLLSNMSLVMERCPEAFIKLNEESLRMHFLVQLNGLYEGQATGETFNAEGRSDILIRVSNKTIFIAECKFWDGEKTLTGAINQLLTYLCWRDTKAALIIFNRTPNFSSLLKKIPPVVEKHPNYKSTIKIESESSFQFILHQNDDIEREIKLAVLAFNVPVLANSK